MMTYALTDLLLSISLAVYVTVSVMGAVIRWGHKCDVYAAHMDYYFPAWKTLVYCFLSNLVLLPVIYMPTDIDALLHLRLVLILSSPFFCVVLIFSYFGRMLKLRWWKKTIIAVTIPYVLLVGTSLVLTLMPGTQLEGPFRDHFFVVAGLLAMIYLFCFIMSLRMVVRAILRIAEENYSNPEDFPVKYAEGILWIPVLHLIMSWSMTFNGAGWALTFGLYVLSVLAAVFLISAMATHRQLDVDRVETGAVPIEPEPLPVEPELEIGTEAAPEEVLLPERMEEVLQAIRHAVEDEKAYLDNHLTLNSLSRSCGINRTYVSAVLTDRLGGFFNYINQCRLAHVEAYKVAHPKADLLEAVLASGFSNRQSYYNARKRLA